MIRFSFFNQGGRVRLDMVGAGGWIHASRLRFPSGSVANAARSWDGPHSAAVAVCWCENGERIKISWKRQRRRRRGFGGVLAVAAGLWWLPSRAWGSTDHVPGSGPPGWHVFFGLPRLTSKSGKKILQGK